MKRQVLYKWPLHQSLEVQIYYANGSFFIPELSINENRIDIVKSATNLGIVFNDRLLWTSNISVVVSRICSMLWKLWAAKDATYFAIRMQPEAQLRIQQYSKMYLSKRSQGSYLSSTVKAWRLLNNITWLFCHNDSFSFHTHRKSLPNNIQKLGNAMRSKRSYLNCSPNKKCLRYLFGYY